MEQNGNFYKNKNVPKYRLITAASLFLIILIIGFISLRQPDFVYAMNPEEALEFAVYGDYEITPEEVNEIISQQESGYRFIDLRSPYEFVKGHLDGAVNIPFESLLKEENLSFFETEDSVVNILYGQDQLQANGPMMVLAQLGYSNLKVMMGGYDYYVNHSPSYYDMPEKPEYLVDEPKYDFAAIVDETAGSEMVQKDLAQPENIIPERRKKKTAVEGGC